MTKTRHDRLVGTSSFAAGVVALFLSWLLPYLASDAANRCFVVMSTSFYEQGVPVKAKCAAVDLLNHSSWSLIFLGFVGTVYGIYTLIQANRPKGTKADNQR